MRTRLLATVVILATSHARAEPPSTALVSTTAPRQGTLPERLEAYGSARPAIDAATSISQQIDGQVAAIAVTPGEIVHRGQRLLEFRPSPGAVSLYRQALTTLAAARAARTHTAQLLAERLATRDQLGQADKTLIDAQDALEALEREGGGQAIVSVAAPFDGIVDTVPVALGARIAPGTPLLTLTARNGLVVTVGLDPTHAASVHEGDVVRLSRLAGGAPLGGRIIRIDGVLNPRTRMVDADVSVPPDAVLSGEAFRADITIRQIHGWLVPHDAIVADDKSAWLFQLDGTKAVRIAIRVALRDGDTEIVTGPIDPKRPVVVDGAPQLDDGAQVRTAP